MNPPTLDFHLCLDPVSPPGHGYRVTLWDGEAGAPLDALVEAFPDAYLETHFLQPLHSYVEAPISPHRLEALGEALAARLLPPPVLARLAEATGAVVPRGGSVRLYLTFGSSRLAELPWEFTYVRAEPHLTGFVGLHPGIHLIRRAAPSSRAETAIVDPLRVLIAWADPRSARYPALLYLGAEVSRIVAALREPSPRPIQVEELPYATPLALQRYLQERSPHVLHFIGHGDQRPTGGMLVLHGNQPQTDAAVYVDQLADWLSGTEVRLVMLSACRTAAPARGVAPALARSAVPAVVAMQLPLRDSSAERIAAVFYGALAECRPVEQALGAARQAVRGAGPDWGVPVLYLAPGAETLFLAPAPQDSAARGEPGAPRHNLAEDARPFVGRRRERDDLIRKVRLRGERLVTLTGMGGLGKTRLAKQVAGDLLFDFPDGVWFVECEALNTRAEIVAALCAALRLDPGAEPEAALKAALRARRLLLVLDCFERLVEHAPLVEDLLRDARRVCCLVTSRSPLGCPGEFEYALGPMTVAGPDPVSCDGIALFAEAAAHVVDGFALDGENSAAVGALCRELEGIPLALILAAGRLRHLSLAELTAQVRRRRFAVLRRPSGREERHADLYQVIAGSFHSLSPSDRRLVCRLGVFVGGFYHEQAQYVCDGDPASDVVEGISRLRDNSLVQAEAQGERTRFHILDTVRAYLAEAAGDASPGDLAAIRLRHARCYARLARDLNALIAQNRWGEATGSLWSEIGNLRAAIAFAVGDGRADLLLEMTDSLGRLFFEVGLWPDFEALADAAEAALRHRDDPRARARLLGLRGALARRRGEEAHARGYWESRLAIAQQLGDADLCADTLFDLAGQAHDQGDAAAAKRFLSRALRLAGRAEQPDVAAIAHTLHARFALARGDHAGAKRRARLAASLLEAGVEPGTLLYAYPTLGRIFRGLGDLARAEAALQTSLRAAVEADRTFDAARSLVELGHLFRARGEALRAAQAYYANERIHTTLGSRLKDEASALLARFHEECALPEVRLWSREARDTAWKEVVLALLAR